jgi:hypothetical protein
VVLFANVGNSGTVMNTLPSYHHLGVPNPNTTAINIVRACGVKKKHHHRCFRVQQFRFGPTNACRVQNIGQVWGLMAVGGLNNPL